MVNAEIITIGDELLIGQVVDTNSAWIGKELNDIGIKVGQITSIGDNADQIIKTLNEVSARAKIVLITGGLGPTNDDITLKTLCTFFKSGIRLDEPSLRIIETIFTTRGRELTQINRKQAEVPDNCTVLLNKLGTAPGMWFEENGIIYVSMPGVPAEMKGMMIDSVLPALKSKFSLPPIIHRTILTQGIPESFLAERIAGWENNLPSHMKLAYLPAAGTVRLRITANGPDDTQLHSEIEEQVQLLKPLIDEFIYGFENDRLEALIGKLLLDQRKTICTAESCTGGYIAHRITSVPGSSEYYQGSVIAYSNEIKVRELGVEMNLLEAHGAVSQEVVTAMAINALERLRADFAIATSGIAGPGGGTSMKPVGTVWLAIATSGQVVTRKLQLGLHRERVIMETAQHALNMLRKMLLGLPPY